MTSTQCMALRPRPNPLRRTAPASSRRPALPSKRLHLATVTCSLLLYLVHNGNINCVVRCKNSNNSSTNGMYSYVLKILVPSVRTGTELKESKSKFINSSIGKNQSVHILWKPNFQKNRETKPICLVWLEPNAQSGMVGAILAFGWFAEGGC